MINAILPARTVKELLSILKDWLDDVNIYTKNGSMVISGLDAEKIAVIRLEIKSPDIESSEDSINGINLTSLYKFIRSCEKDELLKISSTEGGLCFKLYTSEFEFRNLIIPDETFDLGLSYVVNTVVDTRKFQRSLREIGSNSTTIDVEVTEGGIKLNTSNDDGVGNAFVPFETGTIVSLHKYKYFFKYIEKFTKSSNNEKIHFRMKADGAISLAYEKTIHDTIAHLILVIAPIKDSS